MLKPLIRESVMKSLRWAGWLGLALVVFGLLWFALCPARKTLTLVLHPWVGYETLYLARDLKWLPETIQLRDEDTVEALLTALKSGQADVGCLRLDEMLHARANGIPLSVVLVFDISADAVLVRPQIRQLADLTGKRIGYDHNALGALVFEMLLEAAGLTATDVIEVDVPPARQLEACRRNEVEDLLMPGVLPSEKK